MILSTIFLIFLSFNFILFFSIHFHIFIFFFFFVYMTLRECEDLSFPKKHTLAKVRCDQILMRACIVRCSDSEFSLWQIFYTTVRGLTKFNTRRSLSDEYDVGLDWQEHGWGAFALRLRKIKGDYKLQLAGKWSESDKISCHAILKNLYEPKMDVILTI